MPRLPPRRSAAIMLVGLLVLLDGCGPKKPDFAPACPRADLLWEAADFSRYRDSSATATQDIRDLVLSGRITGIQAKCQQGDTAAELTADLAVAIRFTRGPAMQGRAADVQYFVAVTEGGQVRDKQIFAVHVVFPENQDQVTWLSDPVHMVFPVSPTKSGAAYTVLASFQFTRDELSAMRRRSTTAP